MDKLRQYEIPFKGLKSGTYDYSFEINNTLLKHFESESQGVFGGQGKAEVQLMRRPEMMILSFRIQVQLQVECDLCLGTFTTESRFDTELTVKFGDEADDQLGDIIIIGANEDILNVAQFVYEYVIYGLPFQRVHPKRDDGELSCDPDMLKHIENVIVEEDKPAEDPRWAELRKLKGN